MFQKVPSRNVSFTLPGELTVVLKHLKKTSRKTLNVLFILAVLAPFLFTRLATAQVRTEALQTTVVPIAKQTPTDEATQKRIEELIAQLGDKEPKVRASAARALGEIGDPQSVQPLIKALSDRNSGVRGLAATALGRIGDPQAVQPLIRALEDNIDGVRLSAAEALGKIGDPQAVQSLTKALEDENESVRRYAAGALRRIGDP